MTSGNLPCTTLHSPSAELIENSKNQLLGKFKISKITSRKTKGEMPLLFKKTKSSVYAKTIQGKERIIQHVKARRALLKEGRCSKKIYKIQDMPAN